jgi:glutamyl-tRNA reductase
MISTINETGTLFAFGVNHKTASVEVRERLHLNCEEAAQYLATASSIVPECVVISTCNRTEVYGVSPRPEAAITALRNELIDLKSVGNHIRDEQFFTIVTCGACRQLFRVATSVDSQILGDNQILGQLRSAYDLAKGLGLTGKILNQLLQRAFKLGKATYTETALHAGAISVSVAAVELAARHFGGLKGKAALIVGTGETGRCTAEALLQRRVSKIFLTNRTRAKAEDLMTEFSRGFAGRGEVIDFDNFKEYLPLVDLIISSTGSETTILHAGDLEKQGRDTLIVDIAVPRDVHASVAECRSVSLRNIDDVRTIIDENQARRSGQLPLVNEMIRREMVDFLTWYYLLPLMPSYQKTGSRAPVDQRRHMASIKHRLYDHLPEIHRIAAEAGADLRRDLDLHDSLVRKLHEVRRAAEQNPCA